MLVSEVDPDVNPTAETPLRGVFRADDAWVATGDLFRRDADGDFWLLDSITTLVHTKDGPLAPTPVRDALWAIDAVDLAVCFGVPDPDSEHALVVGAVRLQKGQRLTIAELDDALGVLPEKARPHFVRVVDEIPVTTWYRPITASLQGLGVPDGGDGVAYRLNENGGYNKVTKPKPKTQGESKCLKPFETVNLEVADGVATVELNRPDALNAWNFQLGDDLRAALETVADDDAVRAVLLTGAGRAFSSGADLAETREGTSDSVDDEGNFDLSKRLRERYHPIIHAIRDMPKPVVSAVNGPAAGIGCSLALSADLIVAGPLLVLPARLREHRPRARRRVDRVRSGPHRPRPRSRDDDAGRAGRLQSGARVGPGEQSRRGRVAHERVTRFGRAPGQGPHSLLRGRQGAPQPPRLRRPRRPARG